MFKGFGLKEWLTYTLGSKNSSRKECNLVTYKTKGRTVFTQKVQAKGTQILNYHPNACLPIIWLLVIGIIGEDLCLHLKRNGLLANTQKGCGKRLQGAKDQLIINKTIHKNCWRRLTNLLMAWIDHIKIFEHGRYSRKYQNIDY